MATSIYDISEVSINFGGIPIAEGRGTGAAASIAQNAQFGAKAGVDGHVARWRIHDPIATVTIRLLQTSPENDKLQAVFSLDSLAGNGAGVVPLTIRDANGRSILVTDKAWITQPPDQEYASEPGDVEWIITAILADGVGRFVGGNSQV